MQTACNWFYFQSLLFYLVLLRACHIIYPHSFHLLLFKVEIWPSRCCRFRWLNSKSRTSFAWELSKPCPMYLFHFSWYHFTFWSNRFCSFAHAAAITISTLLCLARYLLLKDVALFLVVPYTICTAYFQ